jgi:TetR/AcrR family transcriptional regulator
LVGWQKHTILTRSAHVNPLRPRHDVERNPVIEPTTIAPSTGRERILREATAKFVSAGYAAVSMQQIADAAGVTKATLYHHFRDKEALFLEVMRLAVRREQDRMIAAAASGATLREQLIAVATQHYGADQTDLQRLFADLRQHADETGQRAFWDSCPRPWAQLEPVIATAIERGEIVPVDPAFAARVVLGAIASQAQAARYHSTLPAPDAALAEQVVDLLLTGLTPR